MKGKKLNVFIKNITIIILIILLGIFIIKYLVNSNKNIVSNKKSNIIEDNSSVIKIPNLKHEDEQTLEVQEANLENEQFERQGKVAYNGANKTPNIKVGEYKGLTYYSQADTRWANHMYSAINDKSQTMIKTGCGPTSAAMIVSSIKGKIFPNTMADLFVKYGYRSPNSGTYWSAFKWIADVFDIDFKQTASFNEMISKLENNNYVVAICKEGLFTYGGHFIVITGIDGDTLKIYDPYLYNGKFTTSTRKAANVEVKGTTVYVSKANFKKYANAQGYFCYKNIREENVENNANTTITTTSNIRESVQSENYKVKIIAKIGVNIRKGASTSYSRKGAYAYGDEVTITATSNGWGKTDKGWICLDYTKKISDTKCIKTSNTTKYTVGRYKVAVSTLNVRKGPGINYKAKTYKELTINARNQNKKLGSYYTNGYKKGIKCDVIKVKANWGLTRSGWIYLPYCVKI